MHLAKKLGLTDIYRDKLGDLEQSALQTLSSLSFADFALQIVVRFGQLMGALAHTSFEFFLTAFSLQCDQHVTADKLEQRLVVRRVMHTRLVALHDQRTEHPPIAKHRYA